MNYKRIYDDLILSAKERCLLPEIQFETHHIIPVSMGGSNKKDNLVDLTPREHLIAHMLLWKIYRNASMSSALWFMSHSHGIRINSRIYEILRNDVSERMKNRIVTQETRDRMSKAFTGRVFTKEHRDNIGKSSRGRKNPMKGKSYNLTEEERKIWSNRRKGKGLGNAGWPGERSDEYKEKISAAGMGHAPYNFKKVSINGTEYQSAAEASRILNLTYNTIIYRIKNKNKKYNEYFYL